MSNYPLTRVQAFSIFDKVAKAFMPPFFMPNVGMAIRAFGDDVTRGGTNLAKHPSDFDLYHIGGFSDEEGAMLPFDPVDRIVISRATDFVHQLVESVNVQPAA